MNYTGMMYKFLVYDKGNYDAPIGKGYRLFYYKNGDARESHTLHDNENNELQSGWFDLRPVDEGQLVVINRTIQ
jgi:hypothetical protein